MAGEWERKLRDTLREIQQLKENGIQKRKRNRLKIKRILQEPCSGQIVLLMMTMKTANTYIVYFMLGTVLKTACIDSGD